MTNTVCKRCGSTEIHPERHGRDPERYSDLCDVCYWRTVAEDRHADLVRAAAEIGRLEQIISRNSKRETSQDMLDHKDCFVPARQRDIFLSDRTCEGDGWYLCRVCAHWQGSFD